MSNYRRAISYVFITCLLAAMLPSCVRARSSADYRDFKIGENIELRYWAPAWAYVAGTSHAGEFPMYQKLEELTGVRVIFEHPPFQTTTLQQLEILQSADNLPDIIEWNWFQYYPGGAEQAISDGIIVRLDELLPRYAPNMWKLITENEEVARWISTSSGSYYAFPFLRLAPSLRVIAAPSFKADWLEAVGQSVPETVEQWHDVLTSLKEHDFNSYDVGEEYPFLLLAYKTIIDSRLVIPFLLESNIFASAFGLSHGFYSSEGTFRYGPIEPEYREMLELLADWFAQGLLHPILAQPPYSARGVIDVNLLLKSGGWIGDLFSNGGTASSFRLVYARPLTRGGTAPVRYVLDPVYTGGRSAAVSAESILQVEAVRWLDLAYSAAGNVIFNFGLEGESYTTDDQSPVLTDDMVEDIRGSYRSGRFWASELYKFARGPMGGPYVFSEDFGFQFAEATGMNTGLWPDTDGETRAEAVLSFFPEKHLHYESVMDEISQYHLHNFIAFISGQRSLNEFPDYVLAIQRLGIQQAEDILTEAWRDFYAKPVR
ncbi:MAG: hypothetical protein HN368_01320 [Spirochaetales bacterium]|nr:hypothetical protein [Spirochaetales bacterium]